MRQNSLWVIRVGQPHTEHPWSPRRWPRPGSRLGPHSPRGVCFSGASHPPLSARHGPPEVSSGSPAVLHAVAVQGGPVATRLFPALTHACLVSAGGPGVHEGSQGQGGEVSMGGGSGVQREGTPVPALSPVPHVSAATSPGLCSRLLHGTPPPPTPRTSCGTRHRDIPPKSLETRARSVRRSRERARVRGPSLPSGSPR